MQPGKAGSRRILIWQRRMRNRSRSGCEKALRRAARGKRAEVESVRRDAPGDVRARIGRRQIHLHQSRGSQPQPLAIYAWPECASMLPVHQSLFKRRAGEPEANARGIFPKVDALRGGVGWAQQKAQAPAQVRGAQQQRRARQDSHGVPPAPPPGAAAPRSRTLPGGAGSNAACAIERQHQCSIHSRLGLVRIADRDSRCVPARSGARIAARRATFRR